MSKLAIKSSETFVAITIKRTERPPRVARAFVREVLSAWNIADELIGDACQVAVELATNVVKHVPDADEMRLGVSIKQGRPMIEVWDPSPEPPVVPDKDPDAESGRGLRDVVTNLSQAWYHTTVLGRPELGKIVIAEL